jgi:hypothetical protein
VISTFVGNGLCFMVRQKISIFFVGKEGKCDKTKEKRGVSITFVFVVYKGGPYRSYYFFCKGKR